LSSIGWLHQVSQVGQPISEKLITALGVSLLPK
jgi:hypothetical protein